MNEKEYRPVSEFAIMSLVSSIAGLVAFAALPFLVFVISSLVIAAVSILQSRRYSIVGSRFAIVSICLSLPTLILAPSWHLYLFNSECLPGYLRVDLAATEVVRLRTFDLDRYANKQICLKGYMVPLERYRSMQIFQLSPDGSDARPERTITITLSSNLIDYRHAPVAVSGTLTVNPNAENPRSVISFPEIQSVHVKLHMGLLATLLISRLRNESLKRISRRPGLQGTLASMTKVQREDF